MGDHGRRIVGDEPFVRVDNDSPRTEFRFDCCPDPTPIILRDSNDPVAWEVMCESCAATICYLTAPDGSTALIGRPPEVQR